jgi:hypothetical protein
LGQLQENSSGGLIGFFSFTFVSEICWPQVLMLSFGGGGYVKFIADFWMEVE